MNYLYISIFILPLVIMLNRKYEKGLFFAGFLLVALTSYLSIQTPGNFPRFTIHRIILICLLIFWLLQKKERGFTLTRFTLFPQFIVVAIVNLISMLLSVDLMFSFKTYLSFTLEMFLFFIILTVTLKQTHDCIKLLKYIYAGLFITAILGIIEKKTGFNPVDAYLPGYIRRDILVPDVLSTFPHRILFGLGMAMAWPLALGLSEVEPSGWKKGLYLFSIPVVMLACYFSDSRGPWLASILAALIMFLMGSRSIKKKLVFFVFACIIVLIFKPGVRDTLDSKVAETKDKDSFKGQTYQYRWELWSVAYSGIRKSLKTLAIGIGPGASEVKSYEIILSDTGDKFVIESWDNEYAATLLETGFLGLCAILLLDLSIITNLFRSVKSSLPHYRDLTAGILASITALVFMMTNVKMFSVQINYLMWMLIASGLVIGMNTMPAMAILKRRRI